MSRDFYELCYDQYKQELSEADSLYQKAGVMLVVIPLIGTLMAALGRIDLLKSCFIRVDIFLFYFSFLIAVLALLVSIVFLFLCICPRQYPTLNNMDAWKNWRDGKKKDAKDIADTELDAKMINELCPKLAESQSINAKINEKRRKAFQRSIRGAAIATVAVGMQAALNLLLQIQGI